MKPFPLLLISASFVLGCTQAKDARPPQEAAATEGGGRYEPASEEERALLERIAALPEGVSENVSGRTITGSAKYRAASGYLCRSLFIEHAGERESRLACGDERGWFFVPDIFRGESLEAESDPATEVQVSANGEATVVDSLRPPDSAASEVRNHGAGPIEERP